MKCTGGGTISLRVNYSGTSVSSPVNAGVNDFGAYQKILWNQTGAGVGISGEITPTPYGNTSGIIFITYLGGAGPAGSTIALHCNVPGGSTNVLTATAIATTSALTQSFIIPSVPCSDAVAVYTPGGAGAGTITGSYLFAKPGAPPIMGGAAASVSVTNFPATQAVSGTVAVSNFPVTANSYSHIANTTATAVKATSGTLHTLTVNTPAAGTVSIFDLASASCTATPSTNTVAVLTIGASTPPVTFIYDVNFTNGICVKASATMDLAASYQ